MSAAESISATSANIPVNLVLDALRSDLLGFSYLTGVH